MARRSRQNSLDIFNSNLILPIGALAFVCAVVIANPIEAAFLLFLGFCGFGAFLYLKRQRRLKDEHNLCMRIQSAFEKHEKSLISYFNQSIRHDLFGNVDDKRWQGHIDTFLRNQIVPDIGDYRSWRNSEVGIKTAGIVSRLASRSANDYREKNPMSGVVALNLTPQQYEEHCADLIRAKGWEAIVTQAARDGGADVIAEFGSIRLVVQCKRYSQPVGNKAVQEVNSAVRLNNGTVACVVAPSGFTRQAQMEAHGLGVHLLHHSDLSAFVEQIARSAS